MPRLATLVLVALCAAAGAAAAGDAPRRIVSANLCADRLALDLVAPDRIVSVSALAFDPGISTVASRVGGLHANRGGAEEILALAPDLVLLGAFAPRGGAALLRRLGLAVHEVPLVQDLDGARRAILELAARLHVPARGAALVAALEARLADLPRPIREGERRAIAIQAGGWVAAAGTVPDSLFARLGIVNAAAGGAGASGMRALDAEGILALRPGLAAVERLPARGSSRAEELLSHRALVRAAPRRVDIPARDWICPDGALADAAAAIAGAAR
jgi:iron complex transport system substrate-binding protein